MATIARKRSRTRRTEGVRTQGRSARVVGSVLEATLEVLGRSGYGALRVEDVAARSGVNKTTIYRRWPTKVDLVSAAIRELKSQPELPDTGALESDLVEFVWESVCNVNLPAQRGVVRMMQSERDNPEVDAISRKLREEHMGPRMELVKRAIQRGEVPKGTNAEVVVEVIFATVYSRLLRRREKVDRPFVVGVVALVVAGAKAGGAVSRRA
ncbi:MAG: TetR/AcrR family transcriptional regulator [Polyangiaceae bacterium]